MMSDRKPPATRDCVNCSERDAMKLQNVVGTVPRNIPLLYICERCGAMLTIPPPASPLTRPPSGRSGA